MNGGSVMTGWRRDTSSILSRRSSRSVRSGNGEGESSEKESARTETARARVMSERRRVAFCVCGGEGFMVGGMG